MVITSSPGDGTSSDSWISDLALPDSQKLLWKRASADVESRDFLQCDRTLKNTNSQVESKKRNSCTNSLFTKAMWRSKLGTVKAPFPRQTPQTHKFPSTTSGHTNHGTQWFSRHPFVCAVCHSKPRVLWMEIRRSRMSAFLTSYAHAFCTVTWRDLVLHVRKNRKRRSLLYRELYPFQKFAIPLENLQFHWSMYPYERGSVSTVVCHLFVVRVPERSGVCSQALCAVSGEA